MPCLTASLIGKYYFTKLIWRMAWAHSESTFLSSIYFLFFRSLAFSWFPSQKMPFIKNGFDCCKSLRSGFALIAYYNSWHYNGFIINENDAFFVHVKLRLLAACSLSSSSFFDVINYHNGESFGEIWTFNAEMLFSFDSNGTWWFLPIYSLFKLCIQWS